MESIAYYDGTSASPDELTVPFNDRSHFFGDGVYDAAMAANGKVFLLEEHLDRFYSSAAALNIRVPMEKDACGELLVDLLNRVDGSRNFVYWQVTRSFEGTRSHDYSEEASGKLWALVVPDKLADPAVPLKLITLEDHRFEYGNIKTLNLLPAVMYTHDARTAEADEAVLHRDGIVTECAHSNVSILKDGVLISHPNDRHILRGIAKTHLIQAAYRTSITVIERPFTLEELFAADEIIVTSSSHLCTFADAVDGRPAGCKDPAAVRKLRDVVYREYRDYTGDDLPF